MTREETSNLLLPWELAEPGHLMHNGWIDILMLKALLS